MSRALLIFLLLLASCSCGKKPQPGLIFRPEAAALSPLGREISELIKIDRQITITVVPEFPGRKWAGYASCIGCNPCAITISASEMGEKYNKSVLLHEIGHCIGLTHNGMPESGEIMSPATSNWSDYTQGDKDRFFQAVREAQR